MQWMDLIGVGVGRPMLWVSRSAGAVVGGLAGAKVARFGCAASMSNQMKTAWAMLRVEVAQTALRVDAA